MTRFREALFLVLVGVLPIHAVNVKAWISWKPLLVVLAALVVYDLVAERRWPYHRVVSLALVVFLAVVALGWPESRYQERFVRLFLALVVGGLVLLVTEHSLRQPSLLDRALRLAVRVGALMGATAVGFELAVLGVFGAPAVIWATEGGGIVERVAKPAYLESGFVALSNWHQDPGYGAAWAVFWSVLVLIGTARGVGFARPWQNGLVIGGLWFWVAMAMSRTGWLAAPIALGLTSWLLLRRGQITKGGLMRVVTTAALVLVVLVAGMLIVDAPFLGGDLDLQFAFRFSQGWDLLADITGLFEGSERFADRFNLSEERADVWPEYLAMWKANRWLGVGLSVGWQTNSIGQEPHNLALELLAETGVVGLLAFLLVLVSILRSGAGLVGTAALTAAFLPSITQTVLFEPIWWLAGALFMAGGTAKGTGPPPDETAKGTGPPPDETAKGTGPRRMKRRRAPGPRR